MEMIKKWGQEVFQTSELHHKTIDKIVTKFIEKYHKKYM